MMLFRSEGIFININVKEMVGVDKIGIYRPYIYDVNTRTYNGLSFLSCVRYAGDSIRQMATQKLLGQRLMLVRVRSLL
jgi:hypothetical protein